MQFWSAVDAAAKAAELVKVTLSKPARKSPDRPRNLYGRLVEIKGKTVLQINHRFRDREEVKNYPVEQGLAQLKKQLGTDYQNGDLFTPYDHVSIMISRKGNARINTRTSHQRPRPETPEATPAPVIQDHNRQKNRDIAADRPYLVDLGVANKDGVILPAGKRKYKQINKFVEIIDGLMKEHTLGKDAHIVDMGSGSGYLTFALYDHLVNTLGMQVNVTGVEMRPKLVAQCNEIAKRHRFDGLYFVEGTIDNYRAANIDMLIALHACDTATDDALHQGLEHKADIMVVAPCCQKQVRRDMDVPATLKPLLGNGILLERQAAMLTDGIRALLLEARGYKTKLFEFIPLEHTAKNVMITAVSARPRVEATDEVAVLKETFGVTKHRLEELIQQ